MVEDSRFEPTFLELSVLGVSDTPHDLAQAASIAASDAAAQLDRLKPDLVVVTGDRWEMLAAAMSANIMKIPLAHIAGGDTSLGSQDDCFRHAITKLSHVHFPTNLRASKLLVQMGERRVYLAGSLALERLLTAQLMSSGDAFRAVHHDSRENNILVNYQPVTMADQPLADCDAFFRDLSDRAGDHTGFLFCTVGHDNDAQYVRDRIDVFCLTHKYCTRLPSVWPELYWSLMLACDHVIGNSSSLIYEAPCIPGVHPIMIGNRQDGRETDLHYDPVMPPSEVIMEVLANLPSRHQLLRKAAA